MMDEIKNVKAEIFDVLVQQEQLQNQIKMLEQVKQQKIQTLNQLVQEQQKEDKESA